MERLQLIKSHLQASTTAWVRVNINTHSFPKPEQKDLKGKTLFITGASRGIGLAIGIKAAQDGKFY